MGTAGEGGGTGRRKGEKGKGERGGGEGVGSGEGGDRVHPLPFHNQIHLKNITIPSLKKKAEGAQLSN